MVAVLGERGLVSMTADLNVSGANGLPQHLHLQPRVVDVVLALHLPAREGQYARHGVPHGRAAPVPDVEGARRVGADELHLHPAPPAQVHAPVGRPLTQHIRRSQRKPPRGEEEVDKPRARHLHPVDEAGRPLLERADDPGGHVPRGHAEGLRQLHGRIAGPVPLSLALWALQLKGHARRQLPAALGGGLLNGGPQRVLQRQFRRIVSCRTNILVHFGFLPFIVSASSAPEGASWRSSARAPNNAGATPGHCPSGWPCPPRIGPSPPACVCATYSCRCN